MSDLSRLLFDSATTRKQLTAFLNELSADQERGVLLELDKNEQARLWEIAGQDALPIDTEFFVPASAAPYEPCAFDGRNSLPAFAAFQKVFYRTEDGEIGGFNNQLLMRVTGPGYYVADVLPERSDEVAVSYLKTPRSKPRGWPKIVSNNRLRSRFVYGGMIDYLRRISDRSAVGRAYRDGKEMPNWFVLVRGDKLDGIFGFDYWRARRQGA